MGTATDRCLQCAVRDSALCGDAQTDELITLSAIGRRRALGPGQVLMWAGDANLLCANVVSGILKVTVSTAAGREQIVGLVFAGDFVGQPFSDETTVTVTALAESDLCIYPREHFEKALSTAPGLERALLRRTIGSLNDARERMLTLAKRGAMERVAGFLFDLIDKASVSRDDDTTSIDIPISRGDLADYLGLTIETVSRQLTRLKTIGAVSLSPGGRTVTVVEPAMLHALADPG